MPPPAPATGSSILPSRRAPGPRAIDAGGDEDHDAAVELDAGMGPASPAPDGPGTAPPGECVTLDPVAGDPVILAPADFMPTHVQASWSGSCANPFILLAVSEEGCPGGSGHELSLRMRADAIGVTLLPGENPLTSVVVEDFSARYQRPANKAPAGVWSTCAGASGTLQIDALDPQAGGSVDVRIDLELPDCSGQKPAQRVEGRIKASLRRARAAACPE